MAIACVAAGCAASEGVGPEPQHPVITISGSHDYILEPVRFARGSAAFEDAAPVVIRTTVQAMREYSEGFVLVDIVGNASADEADGETIALERAKRVRDAMIAYGIEAARLRVKSFGSHCPIDEHRPEMNRRVEFRVIRNSGGDTGVEVGCDAAQ